MGQMGQQLGKKRASYPTQTTHEELIIDSQLHLSEVGSVSS